MTSGRPQSDSTSSMCSTSREMPIWNRGTIVVESRSPWLASRFGSQWMLSSASPPMLALAASEILPCRAAAAAVLASTSWMALDHGPRDLA